VSTVQCTFTEQRGRSIINLAGCSSKHW